MTALVVCLDGTNQFKTQTYPTNIARIFDALGGAATDAGNGSFETGGVAPQPVFGKYLPGVGSQGDVVLKVLGNAFGDGIAEPIIRGYTFLSRSYTAGDDIFLSGFSRGATAARALAGLVASRGLLNPARYNTGDKSAAYLRAVAAWYAYRAPNASLADQTRLAMIGGTLGQTVPTLNPNDFIAPPPIKAVGVFDTVSSLGLPQIGAGGAPVFDFSICDTALSPDVEFGFHALSADENRDLFSPTFWAQRDNVVQQVFPGCHSDVGGGFAHRGLSDGALAWMLDRLTDAGMPNNRALLNPALDPEALDIAEDDGASFPFNLTPRSARAFPESVAPSDTLKARWSQLAEMLPSLAPAPYRARGTYADGQSLL